MNPAAIDTGVANVYHAPGDVRTEEFLKPTTGHGEILLRIDACAICGTDIKALAKGNPRLQPPMIMGHELCGTVIECGFGVDSLHEGQRVTMATTLGCGECTYCREGATNLCRSAEAMGFHHPGAMATWMRVPSKAVRGGYVVPVDDLEAEVAAMAEPLSCALNSHRKVPMDQVRSVLIIGLGPLGMLHTLAVQSLGVPLIYGVELPGPRLDLARELGAKHVLTPDEMENAWPELTEGEGFDLVIVTAPHNQTQADAVRFARKGGWVCLFGSLPVGEEFISLNSRTVHYGELRVYGSSDSTAVDVRQAIGMLQDQRDRFAKLITHRLRMDQIHDGFDAIRRGNAMKVVLTP